MKFLIMVLALTVSMLMNTTAMTSVAEAVVPTTRIATTPQSSVTTDGDILAMAVQSVGGRRVLAISGNFTKVITPNGTRHSVKHLAVIDQYDPNTVIYKGTGINSYVRSMVFSGNVLYFGGDFTTVNGVSRNRVAAIDISTKKLLPWNPGASYSVHAIATNGRAVFYASKGSYVRAVGVTNGTTIWSQPVSGGTVKVLMLNPTGTRLYVGGLFEKVGTLTQHGLVKLHAGDGAIIREFATTFRPDSGVGSQGTYDGDAILSLDWDARYASPRLVVGSGGAKRNALFYLDIVTGKEVNGTGTPWGTSMRRHEGDVQAVAVVGDAYVTGFHRSHENTLGYNYDRFTALWSSQDGVLQENWRLGLWGNQANADGGNLGVQAMAYDKESRKLFIGGAFLGYGDTSLHMVGAPGVHRQSLAVYTVR